MLVALAFLGAHVTCAQPQQMVSIEVHPTHSNDLLPLSTRRLEETVVDIEATAINGLVCPIAPPCGRRSLAPFIRNVAGNYFDMDVSRLDVADFNVEMQNMHLADMRAIILDPCVTMTPGFEPSYYTYFLTIPASDGGTIDMRGYCETRTIVPPCRCEITEAECRANNCNLYLVDEHDIRRFPLNHQVQVLSLNRTNGATAADRETPELSALILELTFVDQAVLKLPEDDARVELGNESDISVARLPGGAMGFAAANGDVRLRADSVKTKGHVEVAGTVNVGDTPSGVCDETTRGCMRTPTGTADVQICMYVGNVLAWRSLQRASSA